MSTTTRKYPAVTVNGTEQDDHAALIILRGPLATHAAAQQAEELIAKLTGMQAFTWRDGTGTITVGPSAQPASTPLLMTVFVAPSGMLHNQQGCSGGAGRRMTPTGVTRGEWAAAERCRCSAWYPDEARKPGQFRQGYQIGVEDVDRSKPERTTAPAGRAYMLPVQWWDGYHAGYADRTFTRNQTGA